MIFHTPMEYMALVVFRCRGHYRIADIILFLKTKSKLSKTNKQTNKIRTVQYYAIAQYNSIFFINAYVRKICIIICHFSKHTLPLSIKQYNRITHVVLNILFYYFFSLQECFKNVTVKALTNTFIFDVFLCSWLFLPVRTVNYIYL